MSSIFLVEAIVENQKFFPFFFPLNPPRTFLTSAPLIIGDPFSLWMSRVNISGSKTFHLYLLEIYPFLCLPPFPHSLHSSRWTLTLHNFIVLLSLKPHWHVHFRPGGPSEAEAQVISGFPESPAGTKPTTTKNNSHLDWKYQAASLTAGRACILEV